MKKILAALALAVGLAAFSTVPAQANDDAAYFLGGMLGGIVLDNILRPGPPVYAAPAPVYVQPAPVWVEPAPVYVPPPPPVYVYEAEPLYRKVCTKTWIREYDPNRNEYIKVRRKTCRMMLVN